jgi:hypothetical protein
LLGALSLVRFSTVSDRFISEIGVGKRASTMKENKLEMMISAMQYLKLQIYPMTSLEETVEFLDIGKYSLIMLQLKDYSKTQQEK